MHDGIMQEVLTVSFDTNKLPELTLTGTPDMQIYAVKH